MKELNVASISDIHLGHPNTPTSLILENLRREFPDNAETGRLDAIFIAGDLFDRSLHLHDPNVMAIKTWIYYLVKLCLRWDIELWVLEGTPSHDWKQSAYFKFANEVSELGARVHYVDTLSIQYSPKLGPILFVPDEWSPEADDTWRQVQQLLQQNSLEKVNFAVMHGSFSYQLPEHVKTQKHDMDRYLSIVEKVIFVGHIHKPSQWERILAHGSFDRLTHGEEEPKGHWRVRLNAPTGDHYTFVENKHAKIYKTYDCTNLTLEDALTLLDSVQLLPEDSAVRIQAKKGHPILNSLDVLRKKYLHVTWSTKSTDVTSTQANLLVDQRSNYSQVPITQENLATLLMERVRRVTSDARVLRRCEERLAEMTQVK